MPDQLPPLGAVISMLDETVTMICKNIDRARETGTPIGPEIMVLIETSLHVQNSLVHQLFDENNRIMETISLELSLHQKD